MKRTKVLSAIRLGTALLLMLASLFVVGLWVSSHYQTDQVVIGDGHQSFLQIVSQGGKLIAYYRNVDEPFSRLPPNN
jgi:hypothetical protein